MTPLMAMLAMGVFLMPSVAAAQALDPASPAKASKIRFRP